MKPVAPNNARLLIISHDIVGTAMAGPGIRYYHLARALAPHLPVTLAAPNPPEHALAQGFTIAEYRRRDYASLAPLVADADICFFASDIADELPQLATSGRYLVVDGYDPLMAEWLALSHRLPAEQRQREWRRRMVELARQYRLGDFFVCASERQRDWWLGQLEASGRLNPATIDADPSLRNLVDVVPYGLPDAPLPPARPVIKGVWPGIAPGDRLLVWGGGLWPWLDPLSAIHAIAELRKELPEVKLVFPGTRHPSPDMTAMPTLNDEARVLATELGVLDSHVFFGDWVPYSDWPAVLQECDVALTLHHAALETRLAFRSRVLEYIWAGLPTVATAGDTTSDLIRQYELGELVAESDVAGIVAALRTLLAEPRGARSAAFARARGELTWNRAAEPLLRFCQAPYRAADKVVEGGVYLYDEAASLRQERDDWRALAQAYARGRVVRALNWVEMKRRAWLGGAPGSG